MIIICVACNGFIKICIAEPEKMIVTPSAKMMQIVFTTNHTRGRNPFESTNQKGQPDPNIPGARRSSPFNRGRQHNADGVKVAEPAASANGITVVILKLVNLKKQKISAATDLLSIVDIELCNNGANCSCVTM